MQTPFIRAPISITAMPHRQGSHALKLKHAHTHIHTSYYTCTCTLLFIHDRCILPCTQQQWMTWLTESLPLVRSSFSPRSPSAHVRTFSLCAPSNIHQGTYLPIISGCWPSSSMYLLSKISSGNLLQGRKQNTCH